MDETGDAAKPEPSMEEILASIRRIIAEDDEEAPEAATAGEAAVADNAEDEDVLELTDIVEEEDAALMPPPAPAAPPGPAEGPEMQPVPRPVQPGPAQPGPTQPELTGQVGLAEQGGPPAGPPEPVVPSLRHSLLSDDAAAETSSAFAALASAVTGQSVLETPGKSIEQLIREMLGPMLKQWLDTNLPDLVEQMVQDEIERLARRRRR